MTCAIKLPVRSRTTAVSLAGNFYVGQIFGPILKFDVNGNILTGYTVSYADAISLAPDQRTLAFAPDDPQLLNTGVLDVVNNVQLPDIVANNTRTSAGRIAAAGLP